MKGNKGEGGIGLFFFSSRRRLMRSHRNERINPVAAKCLHIKLAVSAVLMDNFQS